jgi:HNH endonuclease
MNHEQSPALTQRRSTNRNDYQVENPRRMESFTPPPKITKLITNLQKTSASKKLHPGIWAFNGVFHLLDSWIENDGNRNVFKFKLHAIDDDAVGESQTNPELNHRRIIPTAVKLEVWKRDEGKCVKCGSSNELHFDHIIPYSRGGTSLTAENIQLLCARHNLQKHDNIE